MESNVTCSFECLSGKCRRPILRSGKCLFHLEDKTSVEAELFKEELLSHFGRWLDDGQPEEFDCTGFVFPKVTIPLSTLESRKTFMKSIVFDSAQIEAGLLFDGSTFNGNAGAYFSHATFNGKAAAYFSHATFKDDAGADFTYATFNDKAEALFSDATLGSFDFCAVTIEKTAKIRFDSNDPYKPQDLSTVRFLGTDVRLVDFGNVKWGVDPAGSIADERLIRKSDGATYQHVVVLYQGLRQNYERRLRYVEASDFFMREMELLRTRPRYLPRPWNPSHATLRTPAAMLVWSLSVAWWWLRGAFFVPAVYYLLAKYGESYRRVIGFSVASILGYPALLVLTGAGINLTALRLLLTRPGNLFADVRFQSLYFEGVKRTIRLFFQVFEPLQLLKIGDVFFRLWAGLLLALLYISLRRKLERRR